VAGRSHTRQRGAGAADGRHPGALQAVGYHRPPLRPARLGGIRLLPQPFPLVLGAKLLVIVTCDGTVTGFCLANPKLLGEREQACTMLRDQPANRPPPGTAIVTDKGLAGQDTQQFLASPGLRLTLIRPARKDEPQPRYFPNWLRQRIEAIISTLKHQLGLERHGGRILAGLWARIVQRLLALNAAIWHNWQLDAPVKRSLIAYDH
jgi:hypothetical protein